jgi:hypothetical protein
MNENKWRIPFTLALLIPFGLCAYLGYMTRTGPIPFATCWLFTGAIISFVLCRGLPMKLQLKLCLCWLPAIWSEHILAWVWKE